MFSKCRLLILVWLTLERTAFPSWGEIPKAWSHSSPSPADMLMSPTLCLPIVLSEWLTLPPFIASLSSPSPIHPTLHLELADSPYTNGGGHETRIPQLLPMMCVDLKKSGGSCFMVGKQDWRHLLGIHVCMSTYLVHKAKGMGSPGSGVIDNYKPPGGHGKLNSDSPEEQQAYM